MEVKAIKQTLSYFMTKQEFHLQVQANGVQVVRNIKYASKAPYNNASHNNI